MTKLDYLSVPIYVLLISIPNQIMHSIAVKRFFWDVVTILRVLNSLH